MLDDEGKRLTTKVSGSYSGPFTKTAATSEVVRRQERNKWPEVSLVKKCLVKLPMTEPPLVEFSDETGFTATVEKPVGTELKMGQPVYLTDIT